MRAFTLLTLFLITTTSLVAQQNTFNNSLSLVQDNDILKIKNRTDHYYSFGMFLNFEHSLRNDVGLLKIIPFKKFNDHYSWGARLGVEAFTPRPGGSGDSTFQDRPFSGIITGRYFITQANKKRLFRWQLESGLRGPAAHAGQFQNWLHELIGSSRVEGWDNQLPNQFLLNFYGTYAKPYPIHRNIEFIAQSDLAFGNNQTYLQQALIFRIGLFKPIHKSSLYGMDLGLERKEKLTEIFLTTNLYGRVAVVNSTLTEEQISDEILMINKNNLLAGLEIKIQAVFNHFGGSFAYHKVSPNTDVTLPHSYGSIGLSYRW